jgi:hypothetical protein
VVDIITKEQKEKVLPLLQEVVNILDVEFGELIVTIKYRAVTGVTSGEHIINQKPIKFQGGI